jgi:hypothetical protein
MIPQTTLPKKTNIVVAILMANQAAAPFTADPSTTTQQTAPQKKINMAQTTEVMVHLMIITTLVDRLDAGVLVLSKLLK